MSEHEHSEGEGQHKKCHCHGGGHGGGGHEEHEGAPEWLISFADNVMLQMGFFVILLAMNLKEPTSGGVGGKDSQGDPPTKMIDAAISIREAFRNPVDINSTNPSDAMLVDRLRKRLAEGQTSRSGPEGDRQDMQSLRPSDYANVCGLVAFDEDSAVMSAGGAQVSADVARKVAGHRLILEVRGYVSAAEAHRSADRGMRLSYERALAVAAALEAQGVKWNQMRVVAGGDTVRVTARATTTDGHRSNQRVELVQTEEIMPTDPFTRDGTVGAGGGW